MLMFPFCYKDMHVFVIEYLLFSIVSLVVLQGLFLELTGPPQIPEEGYMSYPF